MQGTHNVVVAVIQGRGVRHRSIHDPALALVLCPNEVLNLPVTRMLSVSRHLMLRKCNPLTLPTERGRVPTSPPNICGKISIWRTIPIACNQLVGSRVAPFQHTLELFVCPSVQIDRLDATDVCAHSPVNARTPNANEDTQVPRSPSRV